MSRSIGDTIAAKAGVISIPGIILNINSDLKILINAERQIYGSVQ